MNYGRYPWLLRGPTVALGPNKDAGDGGGSEDDTGGADDGGEDDAGDGDGEAEGEEEGSNDTAAAAGGEEEEEEPPKPKRVPWQTKRIDKLTAEKSELADENRRLREQLAKGGKADDEDEPPARRDAQGRVYTEEEFNAEAERRAQNKNLNKRVDALYEDAEKIDPKINDRLPALREAFGQTLSQRADFFEALTDLDNGAQVLNDLTKDLDELAELLELSPARLGARLAKMDAKHGPKDPPVSRAGTTRRPPTPLRGNGAVDVDLYDPNVDDDAFYAQRAKAREERAKNRDW